MAGDLQLQVKVNTQGLVSGLKVSTDSVEAAAALMQQGLANAGGGAKDAGKNFDGFLSSLKDFKAEQVQAGRQARFFAGELTSIIPGAEGAKSALQGLLVVGLEGFGIGAAMEAAKFVLEQVAAVVTDNEERAKKLRHAYQETADAIGASFEAVRRWLEPLSATQKAWLADQDKVREANRKTATEAKDYYESFGATLRDVASIWSFGIIDGSAQKIAKMMEEAAQRTRALKNKESARDATQAEEDAKTHEKFLREQVTLEASTKDEIAKIKARLSVEVGALGEQRFASDLDRVNRQIALERQAAAEIAQIKSQRQAEFINTWLEKEKVFATAQGAISLDQVEAEFKIREKYRLRTSAEDQRAMQAEIDLTKLTANHKIDLQTRAYEAYKAQVIDKGEQALRDAGDRADAYQEEQLKKYLARLQDIASKTTPIAKDIGDALGVALEGIASGTKSVEAAFTSMGKSIVSTVVDAAIKSVEAYAISSEAAAFFSEAGIPIIGPILAVGAAATAGSFVKGLLSGLPSAAGGWKVPTDTIAMVHAGEHILPREIAQNYEGSDGGGGFGELHVHVHAMDGQSVERVVMGEPFQRALKNAARRGLRG